ncbi:MAG: penicillin-binding protein 2 [Acutalibacteraceae bacterium]|nr:penicillin-binding protein 2 [Acutalibacteraceae bacterium]
MQISSKRVIACYTMAVIMLFICVLRVFSVMRNEVYSSASSNPVRRVVPLNVSRGTIYDCNGQKLTNSKTTVYAVIFNTPSAMTAVYKYFSGIEIEQITKELTQNGFSVQRVSQPVECEGIYCVETSVNADDSLAAKHIIGYTDSRGIGVSGLQASYDEILKGEKQNSVTFILNGQGKVLKGEDIEFRYDYAKENEGIKITIDKDLQRITEQAAMNIECGAVVVTEVATGKIRAAVSRPDYKLSDLASAMKDSNKPLLNRLLSTYNIGSVFKPYVSAAGYETGKNFSTECVGYTDVEGLTFSCHRLHGHGPVDMTLALKFSCNSYFYNYIGEVGAEKVFETARKAGFESTVYLADGLVGRAGSLGTVLPENLTARAMANISIGQGELMLSPLAITNMYMAIAGNGSYRPVSLVEEIIQNGKSKELLLPASVRVMSEETARRLRYDLSTVLEEEGTGTAAKPNLTTAAGKTGTAQTGIVKNGKKVTNSWFCGFFPLENPKYAVTVLAENSAAGCGSVFRAIADGVTEYQVRQTYALD